MSRKVSLLILLTMALGGCRHGAEKAETKAAPEVAPAPAGMVPLHIVANVPAGAGDVYVTGSLPEMGPWDPAKLKMSGTGAKREATVNVALGTKVELKFTHGAWDKEAQEPDGSIPGNKTVEVTGEQTVEYTVSGFREPGPVDPAGSGVKGTLTYWRDVPSTNLGNTRDVSVWLPPGYDKNGTTRYPVLYMHDGQNLFDPRMSFTHVDWGVDESIVRLVEAGKIPPTIVIGPFCTARRSEEYLPTVDGEKYAKFLIEELKPRVDKEFRTLPDRAHTATMGSSYGGIIALYLLTDHSDVFGSAACLSLGVSDKIRPWVGEVMTSNVMSKDVHLYVDYDAPAPAGSPIANNLPEIRNSLDALMKQWSWPQGDRFVLKGYPELHTEASWRARLDGPMEFVLGPMK